MPMKNCYSTRNAPRNRHMEASESTLNNKSLNHAEESEFIGSSILLPV